MGPTASERGTTGLIADVAWCLLVAVFAVRAVAAEEADVVQVLSGVTAIAAVVVRRRWPIPTLGGGLALAFVSMIVAEEPTALLPVCVLLIYHVARHADRRASIAAGAGGVTVLTASVVIVSGQFGTEMFAAVAWPTLAAAVGDAGRSRAEVVAAAVERAERAERTRDDLARRQVVEERLRIARDLHDVVAHNIAVVNVQTSVADHLLRSDPDAAQAALAHVRTSSRLVLDELADILGVLRSNDDMSQPTQPTPTLDALPSLIEQTTATTGLQVVYQTSGAARPLSPTTSIAAYRVLQEALTNAQKHGDGRADVDVEFSTDLLRITVRNRARTDDPDCAAGYGLIGMNERVTAAGGTLTTGYLQTGVFLVDATFPIVPKTSDAAQHISGEHR